MYLIFIATFSLVLAVVFKNGAAAAAAWLTGIAVLHAIEEYRGRLWVYFGTITGASWLNTLKPAVGTLLIVAPALLLQCTAVILAFSAETVNAFWLAVLIGARVGDALFSHVMPFARGVAPLPASHGSTQLNPGLSSAAIYLVDSAVLAIAYSALLFAPTSTALFGLAAGAGFFALVQPALALTRR